MSLKKSLMARTLGLAEDDSTPEMAAPPPQKLRVPRVAPGGNFMLNDELEAAQARLREFEGSVPVRRLDPARIRASSFKNRDESAFHTADFEDLRASIAAQGGNEVPIRVRTVSGDPDHDYEIVYGHRRHRACLLSGTKVVAEIVEANDRELFAAMTRENSQRNDLTPYEWGVHYDRGLKSKLYSTHEQLASDTGRSPGHVSLCLAIARLPAEILEAFPSRLEIQLKWGALIADALGRDREVVLSRAAELRSRAGRSTREVFHGLIEDAGGRSDGRSYDVKVGNRKVATVNSQNGVVTVRFAKNALPAKKIADLRRAVAELLAD